jgi:hypothetical protein
MPTRTIQEVLQDHLTLAVIGDVDTDLERNFADDCVLLTSFGVFKGKAGARAAARLLADQLPHARFDYRTELWDGELAFLEWTADSDRARVDDGADSYLIRNGRIEAMTIHYTVRPLPPQATSVHH